MKNLKADELVFKITDILPVRLADEINAMRSWRMDFPDGLSELRLRSDGVSFAVISGECLPLCSRLSSGELGRIYKTSLSGSVYAYKEEIAEGFVTLPNGIRVGICGDARYDGGEICSVSDVRTLVFRLPTGVSENAENIYALWASRGGGMLIFSSPGVGKTSALRRIAYYIGTGECAKRTVVVDERREFIPEDYSDACVDILRGYKKSKGIEIAQRTLGAEVIIIDEIGNDSEAQAILAAGRGGVSVIATAHGASYEELRTKRGIGELIACGFFDTVVRLYKEGGRFCYETQAHNTEVEVRSLMRQTRSVLKHDA